MKNPTSFDPFDFVACLAKDPTASVVWSRLLDPNEDGLDKGDDEMFDLDLYLFAKPPQDFPFDNQALKQAIESVDEASLVKIIRGGFDLCRVFQGDATPKKALLFARIGDILELAGDVLFEKLCSSSPQVVSVSFGVDLPPNNQMQLIWSALEHKDQSVLKKLLTSGLTNSVVLAHCFGGLLCDILAHRGQKKSDGPDLHRAHRLAEFLSLGQVLPSGVFEALAVQKTQPPTPDPRRALVLEQLDLALEIFSDRVVAKDFGRDMHDFFGCTPQLDKLILSWSVQDVASQNQAHQPPSRKM